MNRTLLVTGGAGFIGSNFVLAWLQRGGKRLVNFDKLTYAGNLLNLRSVEGDPRYTFVRGDINERPLVASILQQYQPEAIIHFAAESHVDRSILGPDDFIKTNVLGTFNLLEVVRAHLSSRADSSDFRFLHVSTDEVYGSLTADQPAFTETTAYAPNSPYSASKAASDHLVRAYHETYSIPTLITNCSNNYGPFQFPEKLIPFMICNALAGENLPVYGDGKNIRDWLHVEDHCEALIDVLLRGRPGNTYNIGGESELTNVEVVHKICQILDCVRPDPSGASYSRLVTFVKDRPGHDRRYAIDTSKIKAELGWTQKRSFDAGLQSTIEWYLSNPEWVASVKSGRYREWVSLNYGKREAQCEA